MTETLDRPPQPAPHRPLRGRERCSASVVRDFAGRALRPLVRKMDEEAKIPRDADRRLLRARHHGHRDPRGPTAAPGATFFMSILAVEELARVDASAGRARRRAEHARQQRAPALGQPRRRRRGTSRSSPRSGWAPTRSPRRARAPTPSPSPAGPRTRATTTSSPGASSGSPTPPRPSSSSSWPTVDPAQGLQGDHRASWSSAPSPASPWARRRTSSASAPPPPAS